MFSERLFQVSLVVSLLIHSVVLLQNPHFSPLNAIRNKKAETIRITYLKKDSSARETFRPGPRNEDSPLKLPPKSASPKINPPPFVDINKIALARKNQSRQVLASQPVFTKPSLIKPDIMPAKKKITLPAVDIDKINNPSYLSYYQVVREKVRRAAYQNYSRTETGDVYLSFIVSREGFLTDVRLVEEKSSSSKYLRGVALSSIKEASPFPDFPKELDYPRLSFNVIISFEIE